MAGGHVSTRPEVEEDDDDVSTGPPPPDGGWGWMVVIGSFMIHIVTDGVTYSFGVFYDEYLGYFNEGKAATSWILSILVGVTLCSGPISSSFVNKWGCRDVTIAGALLASICLVASVWAQNVATLYITIGLGTGFGFGLIYLPAIVSVTMYFEKRRSLATGIAVCGSGFGTFIFAPIINKLILEYGWRGALLIIGGIVLECMIFGALFRPLEYDKKTKRAMKHEKEMVIALKSTNGGLDIHVSENNLQANYMNGSIATYEADEDKQEMLRPRSMGHFTIPRGGSSTTPAANGGIPGGKPLLEQNGNHVLVANGKKNGEVARLALSQPMLLTSSVNQGRQYASNRGPLHKRDVFYQGSLLNIPSYRSRSDLKIDDEHMQLRRLSSATSRRPSSKDCKLCGCIPCSTNTKDTVNGMLDFSLFRDVIFVLFTLSNFLTSIGFNVPYVYIVSRARELGISTEDASMLLSIIGIANTVGRIILGYLSDKDWVNRLYVYNVCLTICGIATALSAFCLDFTMLAIYAAVFGFTIGAYVGLTSVILVDLLGLDKLTSAFGLLLLFQGIASFVGSPFAGMLYDGLGSYDPGFYMAGITMAGSGLMLFAIPPIQRHRDRKEREAASNGGHARDCTATSPL